MARKLRVQFPGALYHVTFRGNARRAIFKCSDDYDRLTWRVAESANDYGVRVYMYCWMPNHGHLLVETPAPNLSEFMRSVLTGYTTYYKSPEYIGARKPSDWLDPGPILALFGESVRSRARYRVYVEAAIADPDSAFASQVASSALALGSDAFAEKVEEEHRRLASHVVSRDDLALHLVKPHEPVDAVLRDVCQSLGIDEDALRIRRRDGTPKAIAALALIRRCGMTRRDAATHLGTGSGQAVGSLIRSLKVRALDDMGLAKMLLSLCSSKP